MNGEKIPTDKSKPGGEPLFSRSLPLIGEDGLLRLRNANVAVIGLGGVGSFAAEALVRSGVGSLLFCDSDVVEPTNLNRQLIAVTDTVGMAKSEAARRRALSVVPNVKIDARHLKIDADTIKTVDFTALDGVIDAVDDVAAKLLIICAANDAGIPVVSSMGAGNKLDPTRVRVTGLYETSVCPLARVMRRECRRLDCENVRAVWSDEPPVTPGISENGSRVPASMIFVPAAAGIAAAAELIRLLLIKDGK